jgi:DNA-binding PadR family transcriptional regulator
MSEARLLSLVARYPHRSALAKHVRDGAVFTALRRLEARGLIWRQRDLYRLTRKGRGELEMTHLIARLILRSRLRW